MKLAFTRVSLPAAARFLSWVLSVFSKPAGTL